MPAPSSESGSSRTQKPTRVLTKSDVAAAVTDSQTYIGIALLVSAFAGIVLLVSDKALWVLAPSHALGLAVMIAAYLALGAMSLASVRWAYTPSLACALLGVMLQAGDLLSASQFGMTVQYFAAYLLGLWAFDLLLLSQMAVLYVGLRTRAYARRLAGLRTKGRRELSYSRRSFMTGMAGLIALLGIGVILGSDLLTPPSSQNATNVQPGLPSGAIANTKSLQANSPVYFEYPSGYPNMLIKKSDGTLVALSLLCTHVCCQCYYDPSSSLISCPCHGSIFDANGQVLQGPAAVPLPKIQLNTDADGNVFPAEISGSSPCIQ